MRLVDVLVCSFPYVGDTLGEYLDLPLAGNQGAHSRGHFNLPAQLVLFGSCSQGGVVPKPG